MAAPMACVPSRVIVTRVTVYHTCSVDLSWDRSVHVCGTGGARCNSALTPKTPGLTPPKAIVDEPACPSGVHMGRCLPHVWQPAHHHQPLLPLVAIVPPDLPHPVSKRPASTASHETTPTISGSTSPVPPAFTSVSKTGHDPTPSPLLRLPSNTSSSSGGSLTPTPSVDSPQPGVSVKESRPSLFDLSRRTDSTPSNFKGVAIPVLVEKSTPKSVPSVDIPVVNKSSSREPVNDKESPVSLKDHTPKLPTSESIPIKVNAVVPEPTLNNNIVSKSNLDIVAPEPDTISTTPVESSKAFVGDKVTIISDEKPAPSETIENGPSSSVTEPIEVPPSVDASTPAPVKDSANQNKTDDSNLPREKSHSPPSTPSEIELTNISGENGKHVNEEKPEIVKSKCEVDGIIVADSEIAKPEKDSLKSPLVIPSVPESPSIVENGTVDSSHSVRPLDQRKRGPADLGGVGGSAQVPRFYFPQGRPRDPGQVDSDLDKVTKALDAVSNATGSIEKVKFADIVKACSLPLYWKQLLYSSAGGVDGLAVSKETFLSNWKKMNQTCHDEATKFVWLLTKGQRNYLIHTDLYPLIQDILETHPGLSFLITAKDFHSRYVATVVSRIFYSVNASWSGRLSVSELRRANFLHVLGGLEQEEDINAVTQYFSYEHFYVIYCKFWELDEDHDLLISKADLSRHNNYAISERMVDRIFSGAVTKGPSLKEDMMTYQDFVWFLLAEEDKRHPRSVEYWFRCMDLDGDGVLSMYELEYFYAEQLYKMEEMGIEPISFEDCLCQMLDMIKPKDKTVIRLADLKACKLCNIFFDTFFNLPKYLEHEQRDPFTNLRDIEEGLNELSDWDRYAAEAYEVLVAEDNNQAVEEDYVYDDDFEPDDDEMQLRPVTKSSSASKQRDERTHFLDSMGLDLASSSSLNKQRKQTAP